MLSLAASSMYVGIARKTFLSPQFSMIWPAYSPCQSRRRVRERGREGDEPVTRDLGLMKTSTAFVTVFMGVRRCSRSSMAMKSGGARPVAVVCKRDKAILSRWELEGRAGAGRGERTDDGGTEAAVETKGVSATLAPADSSSQARRAGCAVEEGDVTHLTVMPSSMTFGPTARQVPRTPCLAAAYSGSFGKG